MTPHDALARLVAAVEAYNAHRPCTKCRSKNDWCPIAGEEDAALTAARAALVAGEPCNQRTCCCARIEPANRCAACMQGQHRECASPESDAT